VKGLGLHPDASTRPMESMMCGLGSLTTPLLLMQFLNQGNATTLEEDVLKRLRDLGKKAERFSGELATTGFPMIHRVPGYVGFPMIHLVSAVRQ
jgi:hypothetical protein